MVPQKFKQTLLYVLKIPPLAIYQKEFQMGAKQKCYTNVNMNVICNIKNKQTKCPSIFDGKVSV